MYQHNLKIAFLLACVSFFAGCSSPAYYANYSIQDLKSGKYEADTSHIYELPYEKGKSYLVVQGYHSKLSHKNQYSLDFKMKVGTPICAVRDGAVVGIQDRFTKGRPKAEFINAANYIVIQHDDGTFAGYWHLQYKGTLVTVGDMVKAGQTIGYSGDTGYSAFPHLHFWVYDENNRTMPTRFKTSVGIKYLSPRHKYRSVM